MTDAQMHAALGELRGQMSTMIDAQREDARAAAESRAKLHARFDDLSMQVSDLRSKQALLEARFERMEPLAEQASRQVGDWNAQRNALLWFGGAVTAVATFAVTMGNLISSWFKNFGGGPG